MDFFFAHKCYFWICNNTGLDEIAKVFRKPLLDLNMAPVAGLKVTSKKTLLCSKIHKNYSNKKLSLNEIFDVGVGKSCHSKEFRRYEKTKAIPSKGGHMNFLVLCIKPY